MCPPRDIYPPKKPPALQYPTALVITFAVHCWIAGGIILLM